MLGVLVECCCEVGGERCGAVREVMLESVDHGGDSSIRALLRGEVVLSEGKDCEERVSERLDGVHGPAARGIPCFSVDAVDGGCALAGVECEVVDELLAVVVDADIALAERFLGKIKERPSGVEHVEPGAGQCDNGCGGARGVRRLDGEQDVLDQLQGAHGSVNVIAKGVSVVDGSIVVGCIQVLLLLRGWCDGCRGCIAGGTGAHQKKKLVGEPGVVRLTCTRAVNVHRFLVLWRFHNCCIAMVDGGIQSPRRQNGGIHRSRGPEFLLPCPC